MKREKFKLESEFKRKSLEWASGFSDCLFLNYSNSNLTYSEHQPFPCLLAAGSLSKISDFSNEKSFETLKDFWKQSSYPIVGYFGYDLKNSIEDLQSNNTDHTQFPDLHFFVPQHLLFFQNESVEILSLEPEKIYQEILSYQNQKSIEGDVNDFIKLRQRIDKDHYLDKVEKIKQHLVEGDIYELNLCVEFFAEHVSIDPVQAFVRLSELSPAPFSAFLKNEDKYLISASPERFLKKEGKKLLSQPIKGTARRAEDLVTDEKIKDDLRYSEKERSENMMIVDLMRNDLAKSSIPGSVKVEEMFGIYSFPQVHQMISTISSTIRDEVHPIDAIKNAFPMGSMTGAPKIRAMELIEKYEESKRGLFSGAVGFITPEGDFDLNVVIRSLLYNSTSKYLSFHTGSAITYDSDPEKEYEECLLKGKAIRQVLGISEIIT